MTCCLCPDQTCRCIYMCLFVAVFFNAVYAELDASNRHEANYAFFSSRHLHGCSNVASIELCQSAISAALAVSSICLKV